MTKSDFIRSRPRSNTASEVVSAAKKARLNITPAMVYSVRARPVPTRGRGRPRKTAAAAAHIVSTGSDAKAAPLFAIIAALQEAKSLYVAEADRRVEFVRGVLRLGGDL